MDFPPRKSIKDLPPIPKRRGGLAQVTPAADTQAYAQNRAASLNALPDQNSARAAPNDLFTLPVASGAQKRRATSVNTAHSTTRYTIAKPVMEDIWASLSDEEEEQKERDEKLAKMQKKMAGTRPPEEKRARIYSDPVVSLTPALMRASRPKSLPTPEQAAIPTLSELMNRIRGMAHDDPRRAGLIQQLRAEQQKKALKFLETPVAPISGASRQELENHATTTNALLAQDPATARFHLAVEGTEPAYLSLHNADKKDDYFPPYKPGENRRERVALDYWLILLRKWITGANPSFRNNAFQEAQGTFGETQGRTHMVISSNTAKGNRLMLATMGLEGSEASKNPNNGVYTFKDFDMASFVRNQLLPEAEKFISDNDIDTRRRMKKLAAFHSRYVPDKIDLHIVEKPELNGHAEVSVQAAAGRLGLADIWPPRGTKLNCLACAAKLAEMGVKDSEGGTGRMYFSNRVEPEKLQRFLKNNGGMRLTNKVFDPRTRKPVTHLRRRTSTSPAPLATGQTDQKR